MISDPIIRSFGNIFEYFHKVLGSLHPVDDSCDKHARRVTASKSHEPEWRQHQRVNEIVLDEQQDDSKPWTKGWLYKELKIDDVAGITPQERHHLKSIVWKYRDCFSRGPFDLGECTTYEAEINLKHDYTPTWVPARPVPYLLREEMEKQIAGLEKAGVIEKCRTKSLFNSPIFLVKKPHQPNKMRFVVDMRMVNSQCLPDDYQIPLIGHVTDKIAGNEWYSTFDCSQSFHQIRYSESSKPITAFTTSNGTRYWFRRMIMGHRTSSAQFCRCMNKLMSCLPFDELIFFLDDLLLASNTVSEHLDRLEVVLQRLLAANMKLSPGKSNFLQKKCTFVGVSIDKEGLSITEERQKTLMDLKPPTNRKSLMSLLGFFGFNRKWKPHYSDLTTPMYRLLKKDVPFKWTTECDKNLQRLKNAVKNSVTLAVPDLYDKNQSYELTIDGSKVGLGAYLTQEIKGARRVIGYFTKAVPPHKREWSQTKLELLSLHHALENWRPYLKGTKLRVNTDCQALLSLDTIFLKKDPTLRRKIHAISEFDFEIRHVSGASNTIADFLSRYPFKTKMKDSSTQTSELVSPVPKLTASAPAPRLTPSVKDADKRLKSSVNKPIASVPRPKLTMSVNATSEGLISSVHQPTALATALQMTASFKAESKKLESTVSKLTPSAGTPLLTSSVQVAKDLTSSDTAVSQLCTPDQVGPDQLKSSACRISEEEEQLFPKGFFCSNPRKAFGRDAVSTCKLEPQSEQPDVTKNCICALQINSVRSNGPVLDIDTSPQNLDIPPNSLRSTNANLKSAQEEDVILREVRRWLVAKTKPGSLQAVRAPKELVTYWKQFDLLQLRKDGLIERKWVSPNTIVPDRYLICIPDCKIEEILTMCHSTLVTNHPGVQNTLDFCRRYFFWPGMAKDVELFIEACLPCARSKPPRAFMKAKRQHVRAWQFNDAIEIDHIEPEKLGLSSGRFKNILSITDVWSGYVVACATKGQTAEETIDRIIHRWVLSGHGVPKEVISDNGPGFASAFYKEAFKRLGCKTKYGLPYECKSTAKVERTNRRLNQSLRVALVGKNPKDWCKQIDYVCYALNALKNRTTGFSANFLRYGHEINTPMDLIMCTSDGDALPEEPNQHARKAWEMHRNFKQILRKVAQTLDATYEKDDSAYNAKLDTPFKAGDQCLIRVRCPKHKFAPRYHGPIKILKAINDTVYVVDLNGTEKLVNISKLKRWKGSNKFSGSCLNPDVPPFQPTTSPTTLPPPPLPPVDPSHTPSETPDTKGDVTVRVEHHRKKKKKPSRRRRILDSLSTMFRRTVPDNTPRQDTTDPPNSSTAVEPPSNPPRRSQRQKKPPEFLQIVPTHKKY